ncbi:hypothetical protein C1645_840960, partial [Glomus cerebriforme]
LIKKCWDVNPSQRPGARELLEIISDWIDENVYKRIRKNTPFYRQYRELKDEYNTFSQKPYQIYSNATTTSKMIDTKRITKLLESSQQNKISQSLEFPMSELQEALEEMCNNEVVILEGEDKDFLFLEKLTRESSIILPSVISPGKEDLIESSPSNLLQLLNKIGSSEEITKRIKQIHEVLVREIAKKKGFSIYFPRSLSSLLEDLVEKYNLQEKSTVFFLAVIDEDDFSESLSMLREFLDRKGVKKGN